MKYDFFEFFRLDVQMAPNYFKTRMLGKKENIQFEESELVKFVLCRLIAIVLNHNFEDESLRSIFSVLFLCRGFHHLFLCSCFRFCCCFCFLFLCFLFLCFLCLCFLCLCYHCLFRYRHCVDLSMDHFLFCKRTGNCIVPWGNVSIFAYRYPR